MDDLKKAELSAEAAAHIARMIRVMAEDFRDEQLEIYAGEVATSLMSAVQSGNEDLFQECIGQAQLLLETYAIKLRKDQVKIIVEVLSILFRMAIRIIK